MKIGIIRTNVSNFGKIGQYNVQEVGLGNSLQKKGHDTKIFYLYKPVKSLTKDETYDNVFYLPSKHIGLHGFFSLTILESFKLEYIILFSDNQIFAREIIRWCQKTQKKVCVYWGAVLSTTPKILNKLYTFLILIWNYKSYKKSINIAKTVAVSREMEKFSIPCHKVINVGLDSDLLNTNLVDKTKVKLKKGFDHKDRIILFVGRLENIKNPLLALEILRGLLRVSLDYKLLIIGNGSLLNIVKDRVHEYDLSNFVEIIEFVPNKDMYIYFQISDVLINLSRVEIFGMALLESMYYGTPVIAMNAPGPREFIKNDETGYILDSQDYKDWVEAIIRIEQTRSILVSTAQKMIKNHFLWDSTSEEFIKALDEVGI